MYRDGPDGISMLYPDLFSGHYKINGLTKLTKYFVRVSYKYRFSCNK
jgi:hypothetical protein